jgi:hypothetical protein
LHSNTGGAASGNAFDFSSHIRIINWAQSAPAGSPAACACVRQKGIGLLIALVGVTLAIIGLIRKKEMETAVIAYGLSLVLIFAGRMIAA